MKTLNLLAFDLGASCGRAMLARFDGERIAMTELHRFENPMVERGGAHDWDVSYMLKQLKQGFVACNNATNGQIDCFGIDTWGVDFGLLDEAGALIENPRCYRDATDEEMLAAWQIVPKREIFARTGIAAMNFNTIYQLVRRVRADGALSRARTLLLMPDLLGYLLTGERMSEYTNVTTTNLYNVAQQNWDYELIRALGIPAEIFTPIDRAGALRGRLSKEVADELGISRVPFAAVGSHDTASAVAAIPGEGNFAFCSCGTWSLFGIDTWGVDFGLIDHNGALLGNPRCYRNGTEAGMEIVHAIVPQQKLFSRTGIASMPFNTVYQLYARAKEHDPALERAKALLFWPDLYGYFFTGE